ncbi:hypothetical protein [Geminocystis sp. NIES-3709]|uniref:hypothetical protein n=1 Tax=Geminocystis sp. NIES-3709 TaxID=1617448 RepID=UPI0005FC6854|nr:hypothetical protein [Geminocystis sp. NIES-3709]BAQ65025.1 hypothetical protein GM3709_1790 [Geminocystis sp. NIES-3709]
MLISSLVLTTANLIILPAIAEAQTPTPETQLPLADTFQPGFWQPVARVDTKQPITLTIINESGIILDYALTDASVEPMRLEKDAKTTMENFKPPAYIVIYPDIKEPNSSRINLKYFVEVTANNTIELRVRKIDSISQGNRTFNLQNTGAIFLF